MTRGRRAGRRATEAVRYRVAANYRQYMMFWPVTMVFGRRYVVSFRLAAYAVCVEGGRVLLVRHVSPEGDTNWTLPGGRVEHAEDPFDTVAREFGEETGCAATVERLLGVDSRVIPAAERTVPGGSDHQNVGIFYQVRVADGRLRPEPDGRTVDPTWTPLHDTASLPRSSLVDIGLALFRTRPATGHVAPVPVTGSVRH